MYKDLLVPITAIPGDDAAFEVALQLAAAFDAHVSVLELVNLPVPRTGLWGLMPDLAMSDVHSSIRAQAEVNVERLRARLARSTVSSVVRLVEVLFADPAEVAALQPQLAAFLGGGERRPDLIARFGRGPTLPRSLRRPPQALIT